ncbi:MAG: hypothetical protein WCL32_09005 [Planctomycetota bacterium]
MHRSAIHAIALMLTTACFAHSQESDLARAGQPQEVSRFARAFDCSRMVGYYIGGGAGNPRKAEPRNADDGTWGLDYSGWLIHRRVDLGWWHGRRYQGGPGAYKTDGPKLIPAE